MDTTQLSVNETHRRQNSVNMLSSMLLSNPELPDVMRDAAPYFSRSMGEKILRMASIGDAMLKLSDRDFSAADVLGDKRGMKDFYTTMKKYIPMNKRQSIDAFMVLLTNMQSKIKPKSASNTLENAINQLTRLNEVNKMMGSMGNMKKLADAMANKNSSGMTVENLMDVVGGLLGKDKMGKIGDLLDSLVTE